MGETAEARLARVEQEQVGQGREIRDIKARLDRGDELMRAIHTLTAQNEHILKELQEHNDRLKVIEGRPAKRWESLIGAIIGAVIAAFVGWLVGR